MLYFTDWVVHVKTMHCVLNLKLCVETPCDKLLDELLPHISLRKSYFTAKNIWIDGFAPMDHLPQSYFVF